jgi:hypothetical protein
MVSASMIMYLSKMGSAVEATTMSMDEGFDVHQWDLRCGSTHIV